MKIKLVNFGVKVNKIFDFKNNDNTKRYWVVIQNNPAKL
jgi:hypothetical protein